MNINNNYQDDQDVPQDAIEAMKIGMGIIHDKLIDPIVDELSEEDAEMLNIVGATFLIIAEQAKDYQDLMENLQDNSDFNRN